MRRGFVLFDVEQEDDDYDDVSFLPPGKKAALAEYTVATALNNRHLLDLHWSVAPPAKPLRFRRENASKEMGAAVHLRDPQRNALEGNHAKKSPGCNRWA